MMGETSGCPGTGRLFTKPTSAGGLAASLEVICRQLIPEIKTLCANATHQARSAERPRPAAEQATVQGPRSVQRTPRSIQVLAIGASTGEPNALAEVVARLPADFPVPIVIVQHMPLDSLRRWPRTATTARTAGRRRCCSRWPS
jgi:two-component system chemotaxis response regulator CheB